MSKEIVVNKGKQTRIAIVENGDLAELFIENQEHERTIGNIFLGRIRRIMPSIQAAFVDIGQKQDAFLHFSDLIENVEDWLQYAQSNTPVIGKFKANYTTRPTRKKRRHPSGPSDSSSNDDDDDDDDFDGGNSHHHLADSRSKDRRKSAHERQQGRRDSKHSRDHKEDPPAADPTTFLKKDQPILVKISKEPIANKGSRITTDISLAGRFLVLVPMANYVAVSKKILSFKERRRLRALARSLLPEGFGVIVRTVADGRSAKALDTDLNLLIDKWKKLEEKLLSGVKGPAVIHEDVNMVSSIMRDLFTEDYDRILLDDQRLYRNIKGYVQAIAPDMVADVKFHEGPGSIFEKVGIAQAVEEAFESRVNLPSGGYLFIEQTEAMHVIDVNSGRAGRGLSQEENSLRVNLEAARVLTKQVRLRDLGGIIVVDFIDMRNDRNRRKVYESLKSEFRKDRAVTKVLPMSDFGLIQITRQRLRPSITKTFSLPEGTEAVPQNWGSRIPDRAAVQSLPPRVSPEDFRTGIQAWIASYKKAGFQGKVKLQIHPFAAAYFKGGFFTQSWRWYFKFGVRIQITENSSMDPLSFQFVDLKSGKDITVLPTVKPPLKSAKGKPDKKSDSSVASRGGRDKDQNRGEDGEQNRGRDGEQNRGRDGDQQRGRDGDQARGRDNGGRDNRNNGDAKNNGDTRNNSGKNSSRSSEDRNGAKELTSAEAINADVMRQVEKAQADRALAEKARIAKMQTEQALAEKAEAEQARKEKAEAERLRAEQAEAEKLDSIAEVAEKPRQQEKKAEKPPAEASTSEKSSAPKAKADPVKVEKETAAQAPAADDDEAPVARTLFDESEEKSASPRKESKPKRASAKKAGSKNVEAEGDETEKPKTKVKKAKPKVITSKPAVVAEAKPIRPVRKKTASPPTRHRLEKYDFSQAALTKKGPEDSVSTGEVEAKSETPESN